MRPKALIIAALLAIVIAAPIVDALACDDCKDTVPLQDMQQRLPKGTGPADCALASSDAGHPAHQENGTARDLCPLCANSAAAMSNAYCGVPSMISHTNHLSKLLAFSNPSYSINKPPQN
jgi:hypothetical protein